MRGRPINSGSPISPHFQICTQQDPKGSHLVQEHLDQRGGGEPGAVTGKNRAEGTFPGKGMPLVGAQYPDQMGGVGQGEKDGPKELWGEPRQAQRTHRSPSPVLPTCTAHRPTPEKPSRPRRLGGGCRHTMGALPVARLLPWNVALPQETRPGCHLGHDRSYQGVSPSVSLVQRAPSPSGQRKTVKIPL